MLSAYYDKTCDSHGLFSGYAISKDASYEEHINKYDVIYLDMTNFLGKTKPQNLIPYLEDRVAAEIKNTYGFEPNFEHGKHLLEANDSAGNTFKATSKPVLIGTAVIGMVGEIADRVLVGSGLVVNGKLVIFGKGVSDLPQNAVQEQRNDVSNFFGGLYDRHFADPKGRIAVGYFRFQGVHHHQTKAIWRISRFYRERSPGAMRSARCQL